jgi:hypothetical protein
MLGIEIEPPGVPLKDLDEVHDRRHLYVHRGGMADDQYCNSYPATGAIPDTLIPVDEAYLIRCITLLEDSARHVNNQLGARFPDPAWVYTKGLQKISETLAHMNIFTGKVVTGTPLDFGAQLADGVTKLESLVIWMGRRGNEFKLCIGGDDLQAGLYSKHLHMAELAGSLAKVTSEKLVR